MKNKLLITLIIFLLTVSTAFSFETRTLPNGQTVVVEQIKNNPIVIIDTWVKTGSINETDSNTGVSHFLEHLLFKGSEHYKTGEFDKILESKGGIVNAATSKDFTHFYIQIPSKFFDTALNLHSDMLLHPAIPDNELEKERSVVIEEISKDLNNPEHKVYENFVENFYTSHPYKRKVIGTKDVISSIPKQKILEYYNKYYIPQNMITIVVGDVDPNYAFSKIQENFTAEHKYLKKQINPKEKPILNAKIISENQPVNSGYMIIGWRVPDIRNNDNYALDVLSTVLADGRSSILYKKIKDEKQLAFSIDASNATYREDGMFTIDANFIPENTEILKQTIFQEINNIISNGVSQSQINLAKKLIENETKYSRESVANIASQIGYTTVLTNSTDYYKNYLDNINKVSTADVQRVAKKYLNEKNALISIVLPEDIIHKETPKNIHQEHKADFIKESNGIKKYVLDNKATVLINKNTANDIVAININAKGGSFLEKIPTTSSLMASTMLKGTKKYSKVELAQIMEENGIKISPQSSNDTFTINVVTTKTQLPKTLEILEEITNNSIFSEQEIENAKKDKINSVKQSQDIPINIALDGFRENIFSNSAYSNSNDKFIKNYPKIKQQDVLNYYKNIFAAQNLVITLNGNVEIDDVINQFSTMFKQNGQVFEYNEKLIPAITSPKKVVKSQKNLGTAWIFTGWQTCGVQNQKDYAALTVIDSLLGSGMSSRLFVELREKEGLAYQIGSSYAPKLLRGAFLMYIGTNPQTLEKSKTMMFKEIEKLKTEPVNSTELQEAKDKIIGRYILSQETNLDKANQIGWFETSGRGFDFEKNYEELIYSVTADDIIRVAKKYFNNNNIISIIKNEE